MGARRWFVMLGGSDAGELVDRASAHGAPVRAVAHAAPVGGCYGSVEIVPIERDDREATR